MKKLVLTTVVGLAAVAAFAQGQVIFANATSYPYWASVMDRNVRFGGAAPQFNPLLVAGANVSSNYAGVNLSGLRATLYWSATGGTDLGTYTRALLPDTTFKASTSAFAGSWFVRTATLGVAENGIANGQLAYLAVVVWDSAVSSDPLSWAAMHNGLWGSSPIFTYTPPTSITPGPWDFMPNNLTGFEIGSLDPLPIFTPTPEPSTFALTGLGAAALMVFCRHKG